MAIKQTGQRWNPVLVSTKKKFIIDSESDVAHLPKCCTGSIAVLAEGGVVFIVNASGSWVKMGGAGSAAVLAMAEEASF